VNHPENSQYEKLRPLGGGFKVRGVGAHLPPNPRNQNLLSPPSRNLEAHFEVEEPGSAPFGSPPVKSFLLRRGQPSGMPESESLSLAARNAGPCGCGHALAPHPYSTWTRDVNFAFPITARRPDARPAGTVTELAAMLQKAADRRMAADAPQRHSRSCASQPGASAQLSPPSGRRNDTQTHLPSTHREMHRAR
jgi:hypothetical protein